MTEQFNTIQAQKLVRVSYDEKENVIADSELKHLESDLTRKKDELKQALNKQAWVDRKAHHEYMKETGNKHEGHIVIIPQYRKNPYFGTYDEAWQPPKPLYMAVGYNNQLTIQELVEKNPHKEEFSQESLLWQGNITRKHYRKFYPKELEKVKSLFPESIFTQVDIFRTYARGKQLSFHQRKLIQQGLMSDSVKVGVFNGIFEVQNQVERQQHEKLMKESKLKLWKFVQDAYKRHYSKNCRGEKCTCIKQPLEKNQCFPYSFRELQEGTQLKRLFQELENAFVDVKKLKEIFKQSQSMEMIKKQLSTYTQCSVRLYMLAGKDLANRDCGSESDPYLKIICGDHVIDERDFYLEDQPNPQFNKMFQLNVPFPGAPTLKIQVWDYDKLFGDDLIGETQIDMDERFFSLNWQQLKQKPIEMRPLYHPCTTLSQGEISLWLEIDPILSKKDKLKKQPWSMEQEPVKNYQVRAAIYGIDGLPCTMGDGVADVYVQGYIDSTNPQQTDTHYRCTNGQAAMNYRLLFDIEAPRQECILTLQTYNRDLRCMNEPVCQWQLDLLPVLELVQQTQKSVHINKQFADLQKDKLNGMQIEFQDDNTILLKCKGKKNEEITVKLDIRIVPGSIAKASPVGQARSAPNMDPYLLPPMGRFQLQHPIKMAKRFIAPDAMKKIHMYMCLGICIFILVLMVPVMCGDIFVALLASLFGGKK